MKVIASEEIEHFVVKIVGAGVAGILALESLIKVLNWGVDFVAVADAQALENSSAPAKIQLDMNTERELGLGSNPEMDQAVVREAQQKIAKLLKGADVVFIVSGMGSETGTAQVSADAAKGAGAKLTIGLVAQPFSNDGNNLMETAEEVRTLMNRVDALIVIPNEAISSLILNHSEALTGDAILTEAIRGISDLILTTGLMDFDLNDVKSVLPSGFPITFGFGEASGSDRALKAVEKAMFPLSIGGVDITQASGILVNITGSSDMTNGDYNEINRFIHSKAKDDAKIKIGVVRDDNLEGAINVAIYLSLNIG
jgi:cell division protein FtsZ